MELDKMNKAMSIFGRNIILEMAIVYSRVSKDNRGKFLNTLEVNVREAVESVNLEMTGVDYIEYVDEGRRPGKMPPLRDISKWARSKGIPQKAVFPIAKNIGRFGIDPKNFISPAIERAWDRTKKDLEDAFFEDTDQSIDQLIQQFNRTI